MRRLLNGIWRLKCTETGEELSASVPGDITVDYYKAGKIPDPYFGINYKSERYLLERAYEYTLNFSAAAAGEAESAFLVFDGIDTFSEIRLNGVLLGRTENMFLRYEYDVTRLLREENVLSVKMLSTLKRMEEIDAEKYFACFNKERIFLRKAQCHFGWDWAPDLPAYGIWNDVALEYRPDTRIEAVRYVSDREGNVTIFTELNYNVRLDAFAAYGQTDMLRYTVEESPGDGLGKGISALFPVEGSKNFHSLKIENPRLWMPNGYGNPDLYAYKVELLRNGETIDVYTDKLGLREVELVQKPVDGDMLSFFLRINGTDVFVKGSNWVPCECFTGVVGDEKYEKLISLAKEGNFNMLRVWGGGIYEKNIFYRLCDEAGIMVWQDFMFACADIPEMDDDFVANVTRECIYQVKRLRNHPSLVYWCGGNEKTGSCGLLKQYGDKLVDVTLRGLVEHYDGTRPYVRQSPFSWTDVGNDEKSGETHGTAFDVVALNSCEEFLKNSFQRRVSFAGECAIMGSCVPESYYKFVPREELWPMGAIYDDRFCDNPYGALMPFADRQRKMVGMMFGEADSIGEFAIKSMAVQAEALKIEILNHRRKRGVCGGFMNWMFSDIWPTGTWAVVDYYGQPKTAYYTMKREYAPFRGYILPDGEGNYFAGFINDTAETVTVKGRTGGVTADGRCLWSRPCSAVVGPCGVFGLGEVKPEGEILFLEYESEKYTSEAVAFTLPFKELSLKSDYRTSVGKSRLQGDGYVTSVEIRAKSYVRMVRIKAETDAAYSDNWFDVLPGREKRVEIYSREPLSEGGLVVTDYLRATGRKGK